MQTQTQNSKKKSSSKSIIGVAVALWLLNPVLLILAGMCYGVYLLIKQIANATPPVRYPTNATPPVRHPTNTAPPVRRQPAFDDCPTGLFCFHRDKGEHHVRHGREIDPWDRPDIDISRYQRRR